jgi:DUF2075 family protein
MEPVASASDLDVCGWSGDFAELLKSESTRLAGLLAHVLAERGQEQFAAWESSLEILRHAASRCVDELPSASNFIAILEYQLPRDERRPDVIVLEDGTVVVIEFKETARIVRADVDQVACYARDLQHYHSACHDRRVVPCLVPTRYRGPVVELNNVVVTPPDRLGAQISALARHKTLARPDCAAWLRGEYAPWPGLAGAARALFLREPLPRIKRAESAKIPDIVERLLVLAEDARREGTRRLVLLTGVPGSGKTLVGLQLVHNPALERILGRGEQGGAAPGIVLSGNAPLVDVLQYALKSKDFVQSLKDYLYYYVARTSAAPLEHVIVFDEAQRAWDERQVSWKHKGKLGRRSEPELLLEVAERVPDWCLVLALLGEGQEIHAGEEGGLALWCKALGQTSRAWTVHAPPRLVSQLASAGIQATTEPLFDLDTTLRSHAAVDLHRWVARLLEGKLGEARTIAGRLAGCDLYVTRDLAAAKRYVRDRYASQRDRRYGLLASSCAENLTAFVLRLKQERQGIRYGRWYEGSMGTNQCCALVDAVSEFGCQGLELDYAIACWGDDLSWNGGAWVHVGGKRRRNVQDAERLRVNAYRVLLTRGRDGTCVFVPRDPPALMDGTYEALIAAGVEPLLDTQLHPPDSVFS